MDGYKAHWSSRSIAYAKSNGVMLYSLPSHTFHFLQPLDVAVFGHFKRRLDVELARFRVKHMRHAVTSDMVSVSSSALESSLTRTYIVSGFEKSGIYPLSLDVMLSKILGDKPGPMVPKSKIHPTIQVETRTIVSCKKLESILMWREFFV
ncbi:hypothetical protein LEN26_014966 [Aphanomyces euteiches]|nr:hypothetical protein LEN26_014966 [Aphanomyces euteiches]